MSDDELQAYATAYQRLVLLGLGVTASKQASDFETLLMDQQGELQTKSQISSRLITVRSVLGRTLVRLTRASEYGFLKPYLTHWQQQLIQVESTADLGKLCLHLTDILFPNQANKANSGD